MEQWLDLARGPIFRFSFLFMILGLARYIFITIFGIIKSLRNAGDRRIQYGKVLIATLNWIIPFKNINQRILYSITSVVFHICLIITPIFLMEHVILWKRGLGLNLPYLNQGVANILTVVTIITICMLIIARAVAKDSRAISRLQDYLLPIILSIPFITGYLVSHMNMNPFSYNNTMFVHVMSGNLIFILIPITKLSHIVLMPATQLIAEVGWHFPADSGKNVAITLKKENEPI